MGGRLQRGANGFAGEPGHMVVDPDGPLCVCGKRGCWERYASGSGIARMAREAIAAGALGEVAARAGGIDAVRGEDVEAAARAGDADALAVLDQFAAWTALGLVNLANILDPEALLVGGGLATMGELLIAPVRRHFGNLLYAAEHRPLPRVELASLGERAGAIGAALLPQVVW
jgi:glucokinase